MSVFSGCDVYSGKRPYDYGTAIWVCSEPYMEYSVIEYSYGDEYYDYVTDLNIDNFKNEYDIVYSYGRTVFIWYKNGNSYETDCLLEGSCTFSKNRFTIVVNKEKDLLFNGKYDELVFIRKDTTNQ